MPPCGQVLMAGSDYLDTLSEAYQARRSIEELSRILVANVYVGLVSLLKDSNTNLSLLLDQLFSLKAAATGVGNSKKKREATLLSDLVCSSDILQRLENYLTSNPQKRGEDLLASLRAYQIESKPLHHRYQRRRKAAKGKEPTTGLIVSAELHAHKMSLVSQVQDLFPDLGSGFVVRLLDVYSDNPETVVAHLLDDSLPPELQSLDRSEQLPPQKEPHSHMIPGTTPPRTASPPPAAELMPARRNVFDDDVDIAELSRSDAAKGKLRFGRADPDLTADAVLADRSQHATNKAAILSALATFDSDDDERDDTYDIADVGGTVDSTTAGTDADADGDAQNRRIGGEQLDMLLFRAYKSNPANFARDSTTRRSQPRASLKRETNMTDEAIEGWAVMLSRDSRRLAKLEDKLAVDAVGAGSGMLNQPELAPTSYRKPQHGDESDDGESSGTPAGRGGRGGRGGSGRGRGGRGGRGGGRPPQSGEQNNAIANQRKEQNKASRANHNRRQQRAKKIARGGGLPG
ncbi:hypothetical protein N7462_001871 [Penicillium macrosclerotiorum]|uniref:uncharacterized protein n=1 Tax=Penicillium macrosclerotiorum TaxID=303699 RepID=UPI002547376F|nr:uncharacterized protein N7462_001871 [Penicillium macrosclerotiorum]KAJ5692448.1 hypothetical protein N7462_001871 [Penicillium macrosclerotiorum]